ncbi:MAG: Ig-like domain repeat protein, partial [Thermoplasmata archaeon]|nr:Ig-like domain repeat protein [Thermoplasmata archaeon]
KPLIIGKITIRVNAGNSTSGIDAIYYKINDREWKKYSNPIKLTFDGVYTIKYYSIDNAGNREETKSITVKIEKSKPSLIIKKPENGIYLFDRKVFPFCKPLIIGKITIRVNAGNSTSGIDRVEFYVDNKLKYTDEEEPYEWTYDEGAIFRHRHYITVKVVDTAGKEAEITQRIWIFNI